MNSAELLSAVCLNRLGRGRLRPDLRTHFAYRLPQVIHGVSEGKDKASPNEMYQCSVDWQKPNQWLLYYLVRNVTMQIICCLLLMWVRCVGHYVVYTVNLLLTSPSTVDSLPIMFVFFRTTRSSRASLLTRGNLHVRYVDSLPIVFFPVVPGGAQRLAHGTRPQIRRRVCLSRRLEIFRRTLVFSQ